MIALGVIIFLAALFVVVVFLAITALADLFEEGEW